MSVLIDKNTRVVVQGITGRDGSFHALGMQEYGTQVVAGVSPTKSGSSVHDIPVFANVTEAVADTGANTAVIYVPAAFAADAIYESADAGVDLIVCITEGIPIRDMISVWDYLERMRYMSEIGAPRLIGPNCPGLISPGKSKVGILPGHIHKPGRVGLVSRSGTLTYEVVDQLSRAGIGQSTCIGIGGDPVIGTTFIDTLALFQDDPDTDAVVLIGEIGGSDEETAADFIAEEMTKPVVGFIAGQTAPPGKRMGHAGAIVSGGKGTAAEKIAALQAAGVPVATIPSEIPGLIQKATRSTKSRPAKKTKKVAKKVAGSKKSATKKTAKKKTVSKKKSVSKKPATKKKTVAKKKTPRGKTARGRR